MILIKKIPEEDLDRICKEVEAFSKDLMDKIMNYYIEEGVSVDEAVEKVTE